jgi:tRNA(Ile)-lysidine synthase
MTGVASPPDLARAFARIMDALGPFEASPRVAVAVSGGADSMAAALLTRDWVRQRGGSVLALIVDHGIRADSAAEAREVAARLGECGLEATILTVAGLGQAPALAERARDARHGALEAACARVGILHLVFGHHAGDQAETVIMRMLGHSTSSGLAGMAALVETQHVRRLRPLLGTDPDTLRTWLRGKGVEWVEDPSNASLATLRGRLRAERRRLGTVQIGLRAFAASSQHRGSARAAREEEWYRALAAKVAFFPQGFALLAPGPIATEALAHLLQVIGGAARPPSLTQVAPLAASPGPATMAGVRLLPAGRFGPGLLVIRETRALQPPVPARIGAIWDGRFRLAALPPGFDHDAFDGDARRASLTLGAWGSDAPRGRHALPGEVMRGMPVLRDSETVVTSWEGLVNLSGVIVVNAASSPAATAPHFSLPPLSG